MPRVAWRCWRSEVAVPKPAWAAIRSTGRSVFSSSCRACSTRCWVSHCAGEMPVSSRKRRGEGPGARGGGGGGGGAACGGGGARDVLARPAVGGGGDAPRGGDGVGHGRAV